MKIKDGVLISINKSKDIKRGKCIIPNGVTNIEIFVFEYCSKLKSIIIPDSVTRIGNYAFSGCSKLTSVIIPNSVTRIGNYAFRNCSSLSEVTIPNSVTYIGNSAFEGCASLTSVAIGGSVTRIGSYAFEGCASLTSITIPDSVTSIGQDAFPDNVKTEENGIYYVDTWVVGVVSKSLSSATIKNGTKGIVDYTFAHCYKLASITIPDSVTDIGEYAFKGCTGLTSVVIGNEVTSMGNYVFYDCSGLERLTIPKTINKIKCVKGFYRDGDKLRCRGFIYEIGETYKEDAAKLCERGFHACTLGLDVFNYYAGDGVAYYEVELSGISSERGDDSKICGTTITLLRELTVPEAANYRSEIVE